MRKLRMGFAGLGMGAARVIHEIKDLPYIEVTAGADRREQGLQRFRDQFGGQTFTDVEAMCQSDAIDAVYVATPHDFHAEHAIAAMKNGKHVIVEKPMALTLEEAERMNRTAETYGVKLMAGHTKSFDPPIRAMMEVVRSGKLGKLLMINTSYYKNFMYRPWSDEDVKKSRGVILNQGPHQVDIVRLIGGGLVKSVRAMAGVGDPNRPGEGHYISYLEFVDRVPATLCFNGYGLFDTAELVWNIGESGDQPKDLEADLRARNLIAQLGSGEQRQTTLESRLEQWRYGGEHEGEWFHEETRIHQKFFGLTIVTCEKGEIRQSPDGLFVYTDKGRQEIPIQETSHGRVAEMQELYEAIVKDRPVFHDGRWGQATLEVCMAIIRSAEEGREIYLSQQVPVHVPVGHSSIADALEFT